MIAWMKESWTIIAAIMVGVIAAAGVIALGCRVFGPDPVGIGDPEIDGFDPVTQDVRVAAAANLAAVNTYNPGEDTSPADAAIRIKERLSGKYRRLADNPEGVLMPDEWELWAKYGDKILTVGEVADGYKDPGPEATSARVPVNLKQFVMHADGDRTPLYWRQYIAIMVKEGGIWKLSDAESVKDLP